MNRIILIIALTVACFYSTKAQTVNLDEYEVYLGDTLIAKKILQKASSSMFQNVESLLLNLSVME